MKKLDKDKMLKEICDIVESDFVFNMELKTMPNSMAFSQGEAKKMAKLLSTIYSIANCVHCGACKIKYEKN